MDLKRYMKRLIAAVCALTAWTAAVAQDDVTYRMEVGGGLGVGSLLCDVNHKVTSGLGVAGSGFVRFIINPYMAVKTSLGYTKVKGNTNGEVNFYPSTATEGVTADRLNYNFSGGVTDLTAVYEFHFLPYGYTGGYRGLKRLTPYFALGFGLTYGDVDKAVTVNLPIGIGVKWKMAERLNLGLEWTMHLTPSDRLDGLETPRGIKTAGFRNKDHFATTLVTLSYDISPKCPNCNRD